MNKYPRLSAEPFQRIQQLAFSLQFEMQVIAG